MVVLEYVLIAVLLLAAIFIIVAVLLQKSSEDGLSGAIAGGSETFYGKDKSSRTDRKLFKWTMIASIIFAVAVLAVYVIQPDFSEYYSPSEWMNQNNYSSLFPAD